MIGIVYLQENNKIIGIVPDVQSYTETDIMGKESGVRGIDLTQANICIVDTTELQVGDVLGQFVDVRDKIPPTTEDKINLLLEENTQLKDKNVQLEQYVAQVNGDFAAFIDQYYIDNPTKA